MIQALLMGIGAGLVIGSPLVFWAVKKSTYCFTNGFCNSMKSKLLKSEELSRINNPSMSSRLQQTSYWKLLNSSKNLEDYEKRLEEYFIGEEDRIIRVSPKLLKKYLAYYASQKRRITLLKMIVEGINNDRTGNLGIPKEFRSDDLVKELVQANSVKQALSILMNRPEGRFLSLKKYYNHGVSSIEFGLDSYFYHSLIHKFKSFEKTSRFLYKNYLLKKILRLKNLDMDSQSIIELLNVKDENMKKVISYNQNYVRKILGHETSQGFEKEIVQYFEKTSGNEPLGPGIVFETYFKKQEETRVLRDAWGLRQ